MLAEDTIEYYFRENLDFLPLRHNGSQGVQKQELRSPWYFEIDCKATGSTNAEEANMERQAELLPNTTNIQPAPENQVG